MAEATAFLDRLGALHAQATPGPWELWAGENDGLDGLGARLRALLDAR